MKNIVIYISDFSSPYSHLNGNMYMNISKMDIARGIITIGRTHWKQYFKSSGKLLNDFFHHWTGLNYYLKTNPKLVISEEYKSLDSSDKAVKTYNIGMGISNIVGQRNLNILHLQHVDLLVQEGIISTSSETKERGDLVGLDRLKNWHIIEAKGRTSKPSKEDKTKAKNQASRILLVNGDAPKTKSYCITYLNEFQGEILLSDPDDKQPNSIRIEIDEDSFIKFYYDKIFKDFYTLKPDDELEFKENNIKFSLFKIARSMELYVGLDSSILNYLIKNNNNEIVQYLNEKIESYEELKKQNNAVL